MPHPEGSNTFTRKIPMPNQLDYTLRLNLDSLPRSLRNSSPRELLDDAVKLNRLLWVLALYMAEDKSSPDPKACEGMSMVCELIEDKIRMALGDLTFPEGTSDSNAPTLKEVLDEAFAALKAKGKIAPDSLFTLSDKEDLAAE